MDKDTAPVKVICHSCGARYTVQISWLGSAVEFGCSCGAHLKADPDDLFQIRHDMMDHSEITLHPVHE
jgi:lysyl-tRNA synthetase class I